MSWGWNINVMWALVVASALLVLIGFGLRDRNIGVVLAGIGLMVALVLVIIKAVAMFG